MHLPKLPDLGSLPEVRRVLLLFGEEEKQIHCRTLFQSLSPESPDLNVVFPGTKDTNVHNRFSKQGFKKIRHKQT